MTTALACMDYLMFLSRIMEAAKALSVPLRSLKSVERLVTACRESEDAVLFLDLDDRRLDAITLARAVREAAPAHRTKIYAFVSHVNEDRIEAADEGLFDRILSRGQFVRELKDLLAQSSLPGPVAQIEKA